MARRTRHRWGALALAVGAVGLSACGGSSGSTSSAATSAASATSSAKATSASTASRAAATSAANAPSGPIVATLHAQGHTPKVGGWPITVTLTKGGRPIAGHVSYAFLFGGQVVSTQPVSLESPNFVGVFHDKIIWPARAVGIPLTLRIIIKTPYGTTHIDKAVQVQR